MIIEGGTGVTSCLSVRLHHVCKYLRDNKSLPDTIDSSPQFGIYRDEDGQNISEYLIAPYSKPVVDSINYSSTAINFEHGWPAAWYNEIDLKELNKIYLLTCKYSDEIYNRAGEFEQQVLGLPVIMYRGNDKLQDVLRTPYEAMYEMALESGFTKFYVQTDEDDFCDYIKTKFDVVTLDVLPRIRKDFNTFVMPPKGHRIDFVMNYLAATLVISVAPAIIATTGNTSFHPVLLRGTTSGVWCHRGDLKQCKKF